jgi:hypothetical protein
MFASAAALVLSLAGTLLVLVLAGVIGRWQTHRRMATAQQHPGGRVFYLASAGNDAASGLTRRDAWRTLARASAARLLPGDTLRLADGDTLRGTLVLSDEDGGDPRRHVVVTSDPQRPATILAGHGDGIVARNPIGLTIRGLVVRGSGARTNRGSGVSLQSTVPGVRLAGITVQQVSASGMGRYGIAVEARWIKSGFTGVSMQEADAFDNLLGGVLVGGIFLPWDRRWSHAHIRLEDVRAWSNRGDPRIGKVHSGSGIVVSDVQHAEIRRCVAWDNGADSRGSLEGPYGIWTYHADSVLLETSVSFSNRTGSRTDGGGFDLDGGTTHAHLRDLVSFDNDGPGLLLAQFALATPFGENRIERLVSTNDARRNAYGAITSWGATDRTAIASSVVHLDPVVSGTQPVAIQVLANWGTYPWERQHSTGLTMDRLVLMLTDPMPLVMRDSGARDLVVSGVVGSPPASSHARR